MSGLSEVGRKVVLWELLVGGQIRTKCRGCGCVVWGMEENGRHKKELLWNWFRDKKRYHEDILKRHRNPKKTQNKTRENIRNSSGGCRGDIRCKFKAQEFKCHQFSTK